jgi:Tubulin like
MQVDHPILVIGLGGTGGKLGKELEDRLRLEICGEDGDKWKDETGFDRLSHQLPSCFQFVYVDIDESDLERLTPEQKLKAAVGRTRRIASNLLPALHSYSDVAQYLHTRAEDQVRYFLPPAPGEPRVAPLSRGAGQYPTVARACLFAKIRQAGLEAVRGPMSEAVMQLRDCAVDLDSLGGVNARTCDVFIAFSVVGGVGNGMFYDYIHLVTDAFHNTGIAIQIYPLVVLPSAFREGEGGGRYAMLNAGRGLLDLARLVDDQNMRGANQAYRPAALQRPDEHGVTYREEHGTKFIQMRPSTLQTAYLFSNEGGLTQPELHGSIASFIMSMAGVRSETGARDGHSATAHSTDINQGVNRQVLSLSGIGGRGMSTAFVTSLAVPRTGITELFTKCLLAEVIGACAKPRQEENLPLVQAFIKKTGLTNLVDRPYLAKKRASFAPGAMRGVRSQQELEQHTAAVQKTVLDMVHDFAPRIGLEAVVRDQSQAAGSVDPFRARRVIFGSGGGSTTISVVTYLRRTPRPVKELKAKPSKEELAEWRKATAEEAWTSAWLNQAPTWEKELGKLGAALGQLTAGLEAFKVSSEARARDDMAAIFSDKGTARQFAHDLPHDVHQFYTTFFDRLTRSLRLDPGSTDAEALLTALLGGHDPWGDLILDAANPAIGPDTALRKFRDRISERIRQQAEADPERSLLPHLADLIAPGAQGRLPGAEAVRNALRGLVPTGALLAAAGPARAIITYPVRMGDHPGARPARDTEVEDDLRRAIDIGTQATQVTYDFRATSAETLTVVLTRTALGITDIPEARQVMALWAAALRQALVKDKLSWRQRLGFDFTWLLTTEEQRVSILQRLLIAMRNGQVDVLDGSEDRPGEIAIRASALPGSSAARLELPLRPWSSTSPWGDLLHAYEESVFAGDEHNRQELYAALMEVMPLRDHTGKVSAPSTVYEAFLKARDNEIVNLEALLQKGTLDPAHRLRVEGLLAFWSRTVPAATAKKIEGFDDLDDTLDTL